MVCGLSWRFLNLDMTLGSRTLTKGKKRGRERGRVLPVITKGQAVKREC